MLKMYNTIQEGPNSGMTPQSTRWQSRVHFMDCLTGLGPLAPWWHLATFTANPVLNTPPLGWRSKLCAGHQASTCEVTVCCVQQPVLLSSCTTPFSWRTAGVNQRCKSTSTACQENTKHICDKNGSVVKGGGWGGGGESVNDVGSGVSVVRVEKSVV